ncbi:MAG TPA: hypothetical protein VH023_05665, partial [Rhodopila sp.]|nr:hypothetical protein [Rhodopila sp.]
MEIQRLAGRYFGRAGRPVRDRGHVGGRAMAKRVTIYGIKACDTMKKARAWLDTDGVAYAFHDYKSQGIERN